MEQKYQIIQSQKQILSQKQLQSLNVLAMANVELDLFLRSEYLENPMLDQIGESVEVHSDFASIQPSNEEAKWNRHMEETKDLKTFLKNQLKIGSDGRKSIEIKEYLIECLEDTGYFTMPLEEAAHKCGVSPDLVRQCIEELRLLEPVGVFSANLSECLLRQLEVMEIENPDLECIIRNYLEDVAEGNINHISRALHISTARVREYILMISTLNPRPAMGFGNESTEFIIPDIIVRNEENAWEIELNDEWIGEYRINDYYLRMMSETRDAELKKYFRDKANRARYIIQNVGQRRQTLLTLMRVILEFQAPFFEGGSSLRPMTMTEVAEQMGVHISTISRAVKGKYVQYPRETVLLKSLFSQNVSGSEESVGINAREIKELLHKWIKEENKKRPYSDQKLREMLEEKGIYISRRVVAKYRTKMGIKGSFDRKE